VIRRSFRIGLTLGLLGGLAFALAKMFGARPEHQTAHAPATPEPWPRLQPDTARPSPPAVVMVPDGPEPRERPEPPPVMAAAHIAEPVPAQAPVEPAPAAKPSAAKPPATKTAAPKAPAAKKAAPKKAAAAKKKPLVAAWVTPTGEVCPTTHPVKAKLASKIFHLPGMLNYERTRPDRCYRDARAAEADDLRPAKR
jgi:hypothetical protein